MTAIDFDRQYFSRDTVSASINVAETDGVTEDDEGLSFDWNAIATVDADSIPSQYREFFDADSFKKVTATVARPIEQTYFIDGERYTFKKPSDELQKSAWSLDNTPYTLGHPDSGVVNTVDQIHGFWKNPRWVEATSDLNADLYFPANNSEVREFISDSGDVSVGFYNKYAHTDEDGIDAYQTDLFYNHVASVDTGRCSGEDGCGLNMDHGHTSERADGANLHMTGETPDGVTDNANNSTDSNMTDGNCDCGGDSDGQFGFDTMAVDAVRSTNENVDAQLSDYESTIDSLEDEVAELESDSEALESVRETIEVDDDVSLTDAIETLVDERESLEEDLEEYHADERESLKEEIVAMSDFDMDELPDDREVLRDKKDTLEKALGSPTTANADGSASNDGGSSTNVSKGTAIDPRTLQE